MAGKDEFSDILMALQGVTVLEAPRVSRETLISTMREHTLILREMKKGARERHTNRDFLGSRGGRQTVGYFKTSRTRTRSNEKTLISYMR